jgi:hypothetical protein
MKNEVLGISNDQVMKVIYFLPSLRVATTLSALILHHCVESSCHILLLLKLIDRYSSCSLILLIIFQICYSFQHALHSAEVKPEIY